MIEPKEIKVIEPEEIKVIDNNSELNEEEIEYGITDLHLRAALNRRDRLKKALAEEDIDVNIRDRSGNSPLHYAAYFNNVEIIDILHVAGADLDAQNNKGQTPLHFAYHAKSTAAVTDLCDRGASIELQDYCGIPPRDVSRLQMVGRAPFLLNIDSSEN